MYQSTMFGGSAYKASNGARQGALAFSAFTVSAGRGEIHVGWLDAVLETLRGVGATTPSLGELQCHWDARRTVTDAVAEIVDGQRAEADEDAYDLDLEAYGPPIMDPNPLLATDAEWRAELAAWEQKAEAMHAEARKALPAPAPMLALPAPTDPEQFILAFKAAKSTAEGINALHRALAAGMTQRGMARRLGLPISTLRHGLGLNPVRRKASDA